MAYTTLENIRKSLADDYKLDYDEQTADGSSYVYKLSHGKILAGSLSVTVDGTGVYETTDYTVDYDQGVISFTAAPADLAPIQAKYKHSVFSDEELNNFYDELGSEKRVILKCLDILLFDSARRFDYSSGQTEMKPDQVFKHLKDLRGILLTQVKDESQQNTAEKYGGSVAVVDRYNSNYVGTESTTDLSRSDE